MIINKEAVCNHVFTKKNIVNSDNLADRGGVKKRNKMLFLSNYYWDRIMSLPDIIYIHFQGKVYPSLVVILVRLPDYGQVSFL